jgi:metal-responsive CopG/Arc/MetJ family transcriptional regulator
MERMNKVFVEIPEEVLADLEKRVRESGFSSVAEFLEAFAKNFSNGCSVTLPKSLKVA